MRVGKSELKQIIKECLVEILAEGLGGSLVEAAQAASRGPRNRDAEPLPGVTPRRVVESRQPQRRAPDPTLDRPVAAVPIAALTKDPTMAAIFADTARTTLVEQANPMPLGDAATQAAARVDPTAMFDEKDIDRWNRAAFSSPKPMSGLPASFVRSLNED